MDAAHDLHFETVSNIDWDGNLHQKHSSSKNYKNEVVLDCELFKNFLLEAGLFNSKSENVLKDADMMSGKLVFWLDKKKYVSNWLTLRTW